MTSEKRKAELQQIADHCNGCLRYKPATYECKAFTDPFPLWGKDGQTCWARQDNPHQLRKELEEMKEYGGHSEHSSRINKELEKVDRVIGKEVDEARHESDRTGFPWIYKMGGGEKADRTNKAFKNKRDDRFRHRKNDPNRADWNDNKGGKKK